jgi:hypothetical protein
MASRRHTEAYEEDRHKNVHAVANLPLSIRIGFRYKMLALLTINCASIGLIALAVYIFNPFNLNGRADVIMLAFVIFLFSLAMMK